MSELSRLRGSEGYGACFDEMRFQTADEPVEIKYRTGRPDAVRTAEGRKVLHPALGYGYPGVPEPQNPKKSFY